MIQGMKRVIGLCVFTVIASTGFAAPKFDLEKVKADLAGYQQKLESEQNTPKQLSRMYDKVDDLQDGFQACIRAKNKEIKKNARLLSQTSLVESSIEKNESLKKLKQIQSIKVRELTQCTLKLYETNQLLAQIESRLLKKSQVSYLVRGTPLILKIANVLDTEAVFSRGIFQSLGGFNAFLTPILIYTGFIACAGIMMYLFTVYAQKRKWMDKALNRSFKLWFLAFVCITLSTMILFVLMQGQPLSNHVLTLLQSLVSLFAVYLVVFFATNCLKLRFFHDYASDAVMQSISIVLWTLIPITLVLDLLGYYEFAKFLVPNIAMTVLIIYVVWQVIYFVNWGYRRITSPEEALSQKIRAYLGTPKHAVFIELLIIRYIFIINCILRSIQATMFVWQVPKYYAIKYLDLFRDPYHLLGLEVRVATLLRATMLFCVILVCGRFISGAIARVLKNSEHKQLKNTFGTLINYMIITIGFFASLSYAGFNFSQFALIAGALSVGIGFGLKNTVTDLLSGIILLAGRTVKPGDYIIAEGEEGHVKEIKLLSTSIKTAEKADVIVPNSFLVSHAVKNRTYHSATQRLFFKLQLEKTEEVEKVEKILLKLAGKNKKVINKGKNKPSTQLSLDDGIYVTLCVVIGKVKQKEDVENEICHTIIEQFKKNKIKLKFK